MAPEEVWQAYYDLLGRHAAKLLRDSRVAIRCGQDDIVQETMQRVLQPTVRQELAALPHDRRQAYVLTVQRNVATDLFRRHVEADCRSIDREKREEEFQVALDESFVGLGGVLAADHTSPEERAERNENAERLDAAIAVLPDREREAITLQRQGLSLSEIAARMGITADAAGGLIFRGLRRLKDSLGTASDGST
jgi:RNA polymerase sigma-70 factor, ECF subfamily